MGVGGTGVDVEVGTSVGEVEDDLVFKACPVSVGSGESTEQELISRNTMAIVNIKKLRIGLTCFYFILRHSR